MRAAASKRFLARRWAAAPWSQRAGGGICRCAFSWQEEFATSTSFSTSTSASSPQPPAPWFTYDALRTAAEEANVSSRDDSPLPWIATTTMSQREDMFEVRDRIRLGDDPKKAARAARHAAVLVPLCLKQGEPAVLFTVRSQHVSTHKGQVSFPGGHLEPGELATDAALREAAEELGPFTAKHARLVCRGTALPAVTGTAVQPVVALLDGIDIGAPPHVPWPFALCDDEVERVFALTLRELHDPSLVGRGGSGDGSGGGAADGRAPQTPTEGTGKVSATGGRGKRREWPVFRGDPLGAEVWGLTAVILRGVLRELLTPLHRRQHRLQHEQNQHYQEQHTQHNHSQQQQWQKSMNAQQQRR